MYCKNCGKEVADGTKFCPDCGQPIENGNSTGQAMNQHLENAQNKLDDIAENMKKKEIEVSGKKIQYVRNYYFWINNFNSNSLFLTIYFNGIL